MKVYSFFNVLVWIVERTFVWFYFHKMFKIIKMEGLTTFQAKQKLLQILEDYQYLNLKQPIRHVHLYVKSF